MDRTLNYKVYKKGMVAENASMEVENKLSDAQAKHEDQ